MKKILFACDLDNTLIHSYKHKKIDDICVEIFNEREQSFITPKTKELLHQIFKFENIYFVPVTTRSIEQYMRIQWGNDYTPKYALVTNGTILLKNNVIENQWYEKSLEETNQYKSEIQNFYNKIKNIKDFLKVKIVNEMYLFAYCDENADVKKYAENLSKLTTLNTQYSGRKIYFFPSIADKGVGIKRLANKLKSDFLISAGDSKIDCPMLECSDIAIVPNEKIIKGSNLKICNTESFSEFVLQTVLDLTSS